MARRSNGELPPSKRWAAAVFFGFGVVFVLLFVYGPPSEGRGDVLKIIGVGLMGVAVTLFAGINLPALDWGGFLVAVLTKLLESQQKKDGGQ